MKMLYTVHVKEPGRAPSSGVRCPCTITRNNQRTNQIVPLSCYQKFREV